MRDNYGNWLNYTIKQQLKTQVHLTSIPHSPVLLLPTNHTKSLSCSSCLPLPATQHTPPSSLQPCLSQPPITFPIHPLDPACPSHPSHSPFNPATLGPLLLLPLAFRVGVGLHCWFLQDLPQLLGLATEKDTAHCIHLPIGPMQVLEGSLSSSIIGLEGREAGS